MIQKIAFSLILIFSFNNSYSQETFQPEQPKSGPGSSEYLHEEVLFQNYAERADGYWLFEPRKPKPVAANVVVFVHGYGTYNPMVYGEWIRHLVRKGNIVIFPRYQEHLLSPLPTEFANNTANAIKNALELLNTGDHIRPKTEHFSMVGHSFGGAIIANLGINYESFEIPKPVALMLCSPGTGWVTMGQLDSYEAMPPDIKLLITVSEHDHVVGDEFGIKVFEEATNTPQRNFIRQRKDYHGAPRLTAYHNETYSLLTDYDSGHRSSSVLRAFRVSKIDAMDYFGYWKWFDALLDCSRKEEFCDYCFGDTAEQKNLGTWSDGKEIQKIEVTLPADLEK